MVSSESTEKRACDQRVFRQSGGGILQFSSLMRWGIGHHGFSWVHSHVSFDKQLLLPQNAHVLAQVHTVINVHAQLHRMLHAPSNKQELVMRLRGLH